MDFPPYCLNCEAMLTGDDCPPVCDRCEQRMWAEACIEAAPAIERLFRTDGYIQWGQLWPEGEWVWLHPMEFLDWCLAPTP